MIEFTSKKPKITFGETVEVTFTAPRAKLEALTNLVLMQTRMRGF